MLLSPAFSGLGLLFLWLGRREWTATHRARIGHANLAFSLSLIAIALAAAPLAYLTVTGASGPTGWLRIEFGASVALVFGVTFVTYALIAAHLVGRWGEVAMAAGLAWAALISTLIGVVLSPQLSPLAKAIAARSAAVGSVTDPITHLDALLAFSYVAFFLAFVDAHYRVAKRLTPEGDPIVPGIAG